MGIQILKIRVKAKDTGRTYSQIAGELKKALDGYDGFLELSDFNVSSTIHEDDFEDLDERELSDNQRQFVEDAMAQGIEIRYDYSGRGMNGRCCPAVSVGQYESFDSDTDHSKDSMGMGTVYYASS